MIVRYIIVPSDPNEEQYESEFELDENKIWKLYMLDFDESVALGESARRAFVEVIMKAKLFKEGKYLEQLQRKEYKT